MAKVDLKCPYCGCKLKEKDNQKVRRFPKTRMIKFKCGFAFLYNTKNEAVFFDVDWSCNKGTNKKLDLFDKNNKGRKDFIKLIKSSL